MTIKQKNKKTGYFLIFILPALIFYTIFVLIPAGGGIWYSFTNWNGLNPTYDFIGLSNYKEALLEDTVFLDAFLFTLTVAIGGLFYPKLGLFVIPVMIGLLLFSFFKGRPDEAPIPAIC